VLIVCSDAANTSVIEQATSGWMIETVVCSSLKEVRPLLAMQEVAVIFCEDRLRDGSYRVVSDIGRHAQNPGGGNDLGYEQGSYLS
jgi:hypothetical protein